MRPQKQENRRQIFRRHCEACSAGRSNLNSQSAIRNPQFHSVLCPPSSVFRLQGFTLIELIMGSIGACIVMVSVAMLVASGQKSWKKTFDSAYSEFRLGSFDSAVALGAFGRKSNKVDYRLYKLVSNRYQLAVPVSNPEEVVIGQAVEFHYWSEDLKSDYMDPDIKADRFVLFYLDDERLKMNFGPYSPPANPGGIDAAGHVITGTGITTVTLTENIATVEFSHTARNMTGDGKGCIRMKLVISDRVDGLTKTTIAATLMRNVWPQ